MKKQSILLIGPKVSRKKNAYGGGSGGYVANLQRYEDLLKDYFRVNLFYLSKRENNSLMLINLPIRFFFDLIRFIFILKDSKFKIIHLLGQYRLSIYREFFIVFFAKLFQKKVIYDIRAGEFISTYSNNNLIYRSFINSLIQLSDTFLVESITYKNFISRKFKKDSYYIPNFLPYSLVQDYEEKLKQNKRNETTKKKNHHTHHTYTNLLLGVSYGHFCVLISNLIFRIIHPIELNFVHGKHTTHTFCKNFHGLIQLRDGSLKLCLQL